MEITIQIPWVLNLTLKFCILKHVRVSDRASQISFTSSKLSLKVCDPCECYRFVATQVVPSRPILQSS